LFGVAERVKRLTYILLAAILVQFSGLRVWCTPNAAATHDCCAPAKGSRGHSPSHTPGCCRIAPAIDPSAIAQPRAENKLLQGFAQLYTTLPLGLAHPPVWTPVHAHAPWHPVSPPLSPLLQTCLLLI
jgi:hypothetical protein